MHDTVYVRACVIVGNCKDKVRAYTRTFSTCLHATVHVHTSICLQIAQRVRYPWQQVDAHRSDRHICVAAADRKHA